MSTFDEFALKLQAFQKNRTKKTRMKYVAELCEHLEQMEKAAQELPRGSWKFRLTLRRICVFTMETVLAFVGDIGALDYMLNKAKVIQPDELVLVLSVWHPAALELGTIEHLPGLKKYILEHEGELRMMLQNDTVQTLEESFTSLRASKDDEVLREALRSLGVSRDKLESVLKTL